jgi:hypothetical protein
VPVQLISLHAQVCTSSPLLATPRNTIALKATTARLFLSADKQSQTTILCLIKADQSLVALSSVVECTLTTTRCWTRFESISEWSSLLPEWDIQALAPSYQLSSHRSGIHHIFIMSNYNSNSNRRCHVMLGHTRPSPPNPQDYQSTCPGDVNGNLNAYFHTEARRYHALGRLEGNDAPYPSGYDDHIPRNVAAGAHQPSPRDPAVTDVHRRRQNRQTHVQDLDPRAVAAAGAGQVYHSRVSQNHYADQYQPHRSQAQYADPYPGRAPPAVPERGDYAVIQQAEVRHFSRPVARVTRDERTGQPVLLPLCDEGEEMAYEKKRASRFFGCFR